MHTVVTIYYMYSNKTRRTLQKHTTYTVHCVRAGAIETLNILMFNIFLKLSTDNLVT